MKVSGPSGTQHTSKSKKSDKPADDGGGFRDMVSQGAAEPAQTNTTQSIAKVDTLLAVQATEDPTEKAARARNWHRGKSILDELEKVRMAMLAGELTVGHMIDIADVVASHREKVSDPALTSLMDEIDLRAQVELAKMRLSMEDKEEKLDQAAGV